MKKNGKNKKVADKSPKAEAYGENIKSRKKAGHKETGLSSQISNQKS